MSGGPGCIAIASIRNVILSPLSVVGGIDVCHGGDRMDILETMALEALRKDCGVNGAVSYRITIVEKCYAVGFLACSRCFNGSVTVDYRTKQVFGGCAGRRCWMSGDPLRVGSIKLEKEVTP